ncbi:chemotaxis protein CheW [Oribacterium sp. HCP28S3_H8]|uniref:chemotaxis protein CheW n=1 Tax=Oribacterium sp. HCP28S3_H8 TaxID=3438945 RepID=UPI003F8B4C55
MSEELTSMSDEARPIDESQPNDDSRKLVRCLTFESSGLLMFISTEFVIEIINGHSITSVPMLPSYVKGIINLRGQVLPIVDIQLLMGNEIPEYTSKTCIIVLNINELPIGIVVDNVRQVIDIDFNAIRPIPVKRQQKLLNGMLNLEDGTVAMSFDYNALINCTN